LEIYYNSVGEEILRKLLVNELKVAEMSVSRHALGWIESLDWIVFGEKRASERRTFNIDGQVN
uniref:Transcriptional regulator n=1 Tax=Gongylonema pulchrum TaxID=637853 RepID=A0A183D799_9BILA